MLNEDQFIERRIIIGLIVSTEYTREVIKFWAPRLLSSSTAKILATWCLDYFQKYNKAPGRDIEGIYVQKLKEGLNKDRAQDIEDILEGLSEEYEREQFNVEYLLDQTRTYFQERHLRNYINDIRNELDAENITEAERLAVAYVPIATQQNVSSIEPFEKGSERAWKKAFEDPKKPLVRFPKELGNYWNHQFVRDGFIAFLAPEKRGKTFLLMEVSIRAVRSGCNVVFFQAGDMSEAQQLRRLGVYLTKRSDEERYCRGMFLPVLDCLLNQTNNCDREERECDFGIFDRNQDRNKISVEELEKAYKENPDYRPCYNCEKIIGTVWLEWHKPTKPLTWKEAYKSAKLFRKEYKKRYKLCTYPNESLSMTEIKALLDTWERQEDFIPDVIIIDYADILDSDPDCKRLDFRNQQNKIWQRLRNLSQERHCLVVTATQAAASSYDKDTLRKSDFSEDKRKYAHVTAMYGLNQTDQEKKIGIMRINEIVVREGDFDSSNQIKILQRLQIGRPVLGSFR